MDIFWNHTFHFDMLPMSIIIKHTSALLSAQPHLGSCIATPNKKNLLQHTNKENATAEAWSERRYLGREWEVVTTLNIIKEENNPKQIRILIGSKPYFYNSIATQN